MAWIDDFRRDTRVVIGDPFLLCLAEALATVESAAGVRAITAPGGLNEIGYKATPGHPATLRTTHEDADPQTLTEDLHASEAAFRLFADRAEQAKALAWLLHGSAYYETARLLFVLAFYSAYAPGRTAGARELLRVFNRLAASGAHRGVRPFTMPIAVRMPDAALAADPDQLNWNHATARRALRLFAELTQAS